MTISDQVRFSELSSYFLQKFIAGSPFRAEEQAHYRSLISHC